MLLALAQLLRLQVLWGPRSALVPGGFYPAILCRTFTAIVYGLLEPTFLLLALFACLYSVKVRCFKMGASVHDAHARQVQLFIAFVARYPSCL